MQSINHDIFIDAHDKPHMSHNTDFKKKYVKKINAK